MKRALALLIACGLLLGVTATSSFAADKVVIKMAGMKPDGEPETLGMRKFGEILKELSGGKYDVQVFPNSQLGKEDAYIASTRKGIIQMCATGKNRLQFSTENFFCKNCLRDLWISC